MSPRNERGPQENPGAAKRRPSNSESNLPQRIDRFAHDVLWEVLLTAERAWWLNRAADFESAKPKIGDYYGRATPRMVAEQCERLDGIARACRARAGLSPVEDLKADVAAVLGESA